MEISKDSLYSKTQQPSLAPHEVTQGLREAFVIACREYAAKYEPSLSQSEVDDMALSQIDHVFTQEKIEIGVPSPEMLVHTADVLIATLKISQDPKLTVNQRQLVDLLVGKMAG